MKSCRIADLQKHPQAVFDEVKASKEPVFVAQNGTSSIVIVDADTYLDEMQALREFERIYRKPTL